MASVFRTVAAHGQIRLQTLLAELYWSIDGDGHPLARLRAVLAPNRHDATAFPTMSAVAPPSLPMFQRPPAAVPGEKNLTVMLWLVATGFFMQTLDATIVNTALPSMAASLGESPLRMQSVVIAYSLTMAVMIPVSGWLADTFGTRRVFFSAILVFSLGSLLCANAHTLTQLVAFRVVQGRRRDAAAGRTTRGAAYLSGRALPRRAVVRRDSRPDRPADRADARRLAREDRVVALDLPDQRAGRRRGLHRDLLFDARFAQPGRRPFRPEGLSAADDRHGRDLAVARRPPISGCSTRPCSCC